jgi:hypothetical protein
VDAQYAFFTFAGEHQQLYLPGLDKINHPVAIAGIVDVFMARHFDGAGIECFVLQ